MEEIVKYENRKMYSRTQKRYVNLADIRDLLVEGKNVKVTHFTGADITSDVLKKVVAVTKNVPVLDLQNLITGESL